MADDDKKEDIEEEETEDIKVGDLSTENLLRVEKGEDIIEDDPGKKDDDDPDKKSEEDKKKEEEDEKRFEGKTEEEIKEIKDKEVKDKEDEKEKGNLKADEEGNVKIKKEDYDKLKKQVGDKEDHIKKIEEDNFKLRDTKRGRVAELEKTVVQLKADLEEAFTQGGEEAATAMEKLNEGKKELTTAQQEEIEVGNKLIIDKHAPDLMDLVPDIVELLKSDDAGDKVTGLFEKTPYLFDPGLVVNLAKRVQLSKDLIEKTTKIEGLEKEIETLKKKPGKILKKIEEQTNKGKKMTADSGGGKGDDDEKETSIYSKSSEELKKIERGK